MNKKGFTLLELLIAIGVLATVATVAVLVVNPAELLKESRDGKRVVEIQTASLSLAVAKSANMAMGSANVIYVSIPDTSATCANLGLPTPPLGWTYSCKTSANYLKVDGTGWIPVNLASAGYAQGALPVDPKNTVNGGLYYIYVANGDYAISVGLESGKYFKQSGVTDGGFDPSRIEEGSKLVLLAEAAGLIGYWPFDENSGTTATDVSGKGHNATFYTGSPAWTTGKLGSAINFNGSSALRAVGVTGGGTFPVGHTMAAWVNPSAVAPNTNIFESTGGIFYLSLHASGNRAFHSANIAGQRTINGTTLMSTGNWYFVVGTYDNANLKVYVNGVLDGTVAVTGADVSADPYFCIGANSCNSYWTTGKVDDVRIYSRPLSADEILAMYKAGK